MSKRTYVVTFAAVATATLLSAQPRRATITGGNSDRGKCTIEVVVDGAAEVEIRGDSANLRNLGGRPAEWRRFQCNGVMPSNPSEFRFSGVDGRGRQELIRDPRNGGPAVIRIEDRDGGAEGYTFDITWRGGYGNDYGQGRGDDRYDRGRGDDRYDRRGDRPRGGRFTEEQAIQTCKDAVADQVSNRYRTGRDVRFRRIGMEDGPGRRDWVSGVIDLRRDGRDESYRFACSVNFDTGRVRNVQIDPTGR